MSRTFRLHRDYWLVVVAMAGIAVFTPNQLGFETSQERAGVIVIIVVCLAAGAYVGWLLQHRVVVTDEGVEHIKPGLRKFVAWEDMRSVKVDEDVALDSNTTIIRITGRRGRLLLEFPSRMVGNSPAFVALMERGIAEEREARLARD